MYRILIVEDHALTREGIRALLSGLDRPVELFEAGSCDEALSRLADAGPFHLVLLDIGLPDISGLAAIPLIHRIQADAAVVILSASEKPQDARDALDAGARGFISKSAHREVVLCAVRLILAGGVYVPPALMFADADADTLPVLPGKPTQLTPRQTEVLHLLAQGKPNKVIGRLLDMAESTVRVHVTAIFRALGVSNRTEAAFAAARFGLIDNPAGEAEPQADALSQPSEQTGEPSSAK